MENSMRITKIYDNGGKTLDRYTVLTDEKHSPSAVTALSLSDNPEDHNGFSQFGGAVEGVHLGKPVTFESLTARVQAHIARRIFKAEA